VPSWSWETPLLSPPPPCAGEELLDLVDEDDAFGRAWPARIRPRNDLIVSTPPTSANVTASRWTFRPGVSSICRRFRSQRAGTSSPALGQAHRDDLLGLERRQALHGLDGA
jgi:hypothetical protein